MNILVIALIASTAAGRYWPSAAEDGERFSLLDADTASINYFFEADFTYNTYYDGIYPDSQ